MPDKQEGMRLKKVVGGILQAVREAKQLGDMESAKVMETYKKDKTLSAFSVPAFTVSDVDVELRFAIEEPAEEEGKGEEIVDVKIHTSPELLKGLEPHQISVIKLKVTPVELKVFEKEE